MLRLFSKIVDGWHSLGEDEEIPFSPAIAWTMLAYTIGACLLWYSIRYTKVERFLVINGLDRHRLVVLFVWLGTLLFLGLLWVFRDKPPWKLRRETVVVIILSMIMLSLFWLYGRRVSYTIWFDKRPPWGGHTGLLPYYFFMSSSLLLRVVIPLTIGVLFFKMYPRDYGFRVRGAFQLWWLYAALIGIVMLVVIFYASTLPAFLRKYPWCKQGIVGKTIAVDVLAVYALGSAVFFTTVEAFWRGYILFGTARELGRLSLFFMVMPYVIGHCGKPLPETLGAIAAGVVLGALALHHRSFWLGAIAHWVIAMTMDIMALWRRGITVIWS